MMRRGKRSFTVLIVVLILGGCDQSALRDGAEESLLHSSDKEEDSSLLSAAPPQLDMWEAVAGADVPYALTNPGVIVHNDAIYLIGGTRDGGMSDEIWRSIDLFHWEQILENAPFPRRDSPALTIHDGKIWLTWGDFDIIPYGTIEDLWYSEDGQIWHQHTVPDPLSVQWTQGIASLNGTLVIFGPEKIFVLDSNDRWYTIDSPFSPLSAFGSAVVNGRLYVVGGRKALHTASNEVWSTADGFSWHREPDASFSPRMSPHLIVAGESLFLLGGFSYEPSDPSGSYNVVRFTDIWVTADASEWGLVREKTPCLDRFGFRTIWWHGKIVVLGGSSHGESVATPLRDICFSPDGLYWETHTFPPFPPSLPPRYGHQTTVFNGALWVTGGRESGHNGIFYSDLWRSFDGVYWEEIPSPARSEDSPYATYPSIGTFDGDLWLITTKDKRRTLWRTSDGTQWSMVAEDLPFASREGTILLDFHGKLLLMGGISYLETFQEAWASPDGVTWECLSTTVPYYEDSAVAIHNDTLFLFQRSWGPYTPSGVIFRSTDGIIWQSVPGSLRYDGRYGLAAASYHGRLWVIGGKDEVPKHDVWSSEDGTSWIRHPDAPFTPRSFHTLTVFNDYLWVIGGAFWNGEEAYTLHDIWKTKVQE